MNTKDITSKIKDKAIESGFDLFGVSSPIIDNKDSEILNRWLRQGNHAIMNWIEKRKEERENIYK